MIHITKCRRSHKLPFAFAVLSHENGTLSVSSPKPQFWSGHDEKKGPSSLPIFISWMIWDDLGQVFDNHTGPACPNFQNPTTRVLRFLVEGAKYNHCRKPSTTKGAQTMNLRNIYEYALAREREGKDFFIKNADRIQHASASAAFRALAKEEELHIEYIQRLIRGLDEGQDNVAAPQMDQAGQFKERAEKELLDQTVLESMVPDLPVLRTAYLIERDFAEFYENMASKAQGQAKLALQNLASWERGHESLFQHLHDRVFEEYAQMPWGG